MLLFQLHLFFDWLWAPLQTNGAGSSSYLVNRASPRYDRRIEYMGDMVTSCGCICYSCCAASIFRQYSSKDVWDWIRSSLRQPGSLHLAPTTDDIDKIWCIMYHQSSISVCVTWLSPTEQNFSKHKYGNVSRIIYPMSRPVQKDRVAK